MSEWWGTHRNVSPRLRLEVEAMRATFENTFRLIVPKDNSPLYWVGDVYINLARLRRPEHTLKIVYPKDYPNRPAESYILKPELFSTKHQYEDGQLCLFNPKDGENYGWNPSRSTAVTVTAWSIQWIYAYYTWRATGDWPGIEETANPDQPPRKRV
jgi:hypothetical protein